MKKKSENMEFTGERYVPEVHGNIELEHLHRYLLACKVVAGKTVLDIASGEGYGSAMLARAAHKVTGVDISQEAISQAQAKYQSKNLKFRLGSCSAIPLADDSVDVVVSFETIEHHDEHEAMMREIKRVLRPGGVLIISSPDKLVYSDKPGYSNPYHVKELYRDEFKKLLALHFKNHSIYGQRVVYGSAIFCEDSSSPVESYELAADAASAIPGVPHAVYLVAVASDAELPFLSSGVLEQRIEDTDITRFWQELVVDREGQIASLNQAVAEREDQISSLNQAVTERDGQITSLNQAVTERDGQIASLSQAVTECDGQISSLNQAVTEREDQISSLNKTVAERDGEIVGLKQAASDLQKAFDERGAWAHSLEREIVLRDGQITSLNQVVTERDGQIAGLNQAIAERDGQAAGLSQAVTERDGQISSLNKTVAQRDGEIQNLIDTIYEISSSTSWRVTAPLRWVGGKIKSTRNLFQLPLIALQRGGGLKKTLRKSMNVCKQEGLAGLKLRLINVYRLNPILQGPGFSEKRPPVLVGKNRSADKAGQLLAPRSYASASLGKDNYINQILPTEANKSRVGLDFVPRTETSFDLANCPIKVIAFYLPQFHPIPENNRWWGKGFTEWTNVSKAVPQFVGHYQPHLPGELGFYDLRLVDVQRQQIELAKQYGIHGFCYHHYWFGGKRLLESPFNQILANPDLDLPFCLCWANENWTRRWDGAEQDILIAQNHSPEDDLAFIADIAPALRDPRYIRFNGRPVLIVYRVTLLPDARATAQRWRAFCRRESIGELYLVAARSFGIKDPRSFGFDAAVEFPPHEANARRLNDDIDSINPAFEGNVYRFDDMVDSYLSIYSGAYPTIKTVCPGWDNEARKPGEGHIFFGSSPGAYSRWLSGACDHALDELSSKKDYPPFVFVNAWNEWAEGAHLEPDRKYGYANLHVTANTLQSITPQHPDIQTIVEESNRNFKRTSDGAVVLHLFYGDLLEELLPYLKYAAELDLFVSLGPNISINQVKRLRESFPNCYLTAYPNRGRDVMPFIELLKVLQNYGYKHACKIHTKKSPQRKDGQKLRSDYLESLMGSEGCVQEYTRMFASDRQLGLAAPSRWFLDLSEPDRNILNRQWLDKLLPKLGRDELVGQYSWDFVAGTMFWLRVDAVGWLTSFNFSAHDFEDELGQLDGTLAHALERLIPLGIIHSGYTISNKPDKAPE